MKIILETPLAWRFLQNNCNLPAEIFILLVLLFNPHFLALQFLSCANYEYFEGDLIIILFNELQNQSVFISAKIYNPTY